jgi:methylglutaconyl-CoA hydratase
MALLQDVDASGIATLTLNRPERHNAFDDALIAELTTALRSVGARADVRAVVLAGAGRSFSAGADLDWMRRSATFSDEANLEDADRLAELLYTLDRLPKPTIAMVQGVAYGGGVGLAACCDIVIAGDRARFSLSEVRLGLIPSAISPYVINAIGARHARRYFLTAEVIGAERALEIGLVHELVAEADMPAKLAAILDTILLGAPGAQAAAKDLVFLCENRPIDAALAKETARRIAILRTSKEGQDGLTAFLNKTTPPWVRRDV